MENVGLIALKNIEDFKLGTIPENQMCLVYGTLNNYSPNSGKAEL